jgi:hypothetical protein
MDSKWFFMHLMATCLPVLIDCALNTSENVPSPFFDIRRYSKKIKHSAALLCIRKFKLKLSINPKT